MKTRSPQPGQGGARVARPQEASAVSIRETCTVCEESFDVQFRYQMEERDGGFSFFCSQKCLEQSQTKGSDGVNCEACSKRFAVSFAAQVFYVKGRRAYACSMPCRSQVIREASGTRSVSSLVPAPAWAPGSAAPGT